ncbi:MAG: NAD(P)/FAD-dependent oxidoreductase [Nocardioides sp.]|uniref:flavin-containing monooxygenase n=1 Tax=Nocardioides sp. TaxID=35761 RepID=UPI0039E3F2CA
MSDTQVTVDHLIVGAGFGGICAAIKLDEDGETDFLVLDRGDDVGGTWRDNTYPGAACDVPSQLYSYSFAPNPDWSMSFSPQPEIQAYIKRVARESGVLDRCVFRTTATDAAWDETRQRWIVTTTGPTGETTYASRTLIVGPGPLSEPKLPEIEGLDTFGGEVFHSARWRHDVDLAGKRVAVIGTGASAIQIVPEVQKVAAQLDVYQRTAPWVLPRNEHRYSGLEKLAFRHVPGLQKAARTAIYWGREAYVPAFVWQPKIATPAKLLALRNIARGIKDPELRAKVTPTFEIGCKRILISNRYYPALAAENTELITDPIARVTPTGIVTGDGSGTETEREIDVLIVATGFETTDIPMAHHVRGVDGELMADRFARTGALAYKGATVPGFPNLFFVIGPNTGLGHSSMVFIIESQVQYIRDALRTMRAHRYATVEPTEAAFETWNAGVQGRFATSVWTTGGCASWYLDDQGRNTTLWPGFTFHFRHLLHTFDVAKYVVTAATHDNESQELVSA